MRGETRNPPAVPSATPCRTLPRTRPASMTAGRRSPSRSAPPRWAHPDGQHLAIGVDDRHQGPLAVHVDTDVNRRHRASFPNSNVTRKLSSPGWRYGRPSQPTGLARISARLRGLITSSAFLPSCAAQSSMACVVCIFIRSTLYQERSHISRKAHAAPLFQRRAQRTPLPIDCKPVGRRTHGRLDRFGMV